MGSDFGGGKGRRRRLHFSPKPRQQNLSSSLRSDLEIFLHIHKRDFSRNFQELLIFFLRLRFRRCSFLQRRKNLFLDPLIVFLTFWGRKRKTPSPPPHPAGKKSDFLFFESRAKEKGNRNGAILLTLISPLKRRKD